MPFDGSILDTRAATEKLALAERFDDRAFGHRYVITRDSRGRFLGRASTRDLLMTYDHFPNSQTFDQQGNHQGVKFERSMRTHDGKWRDGTGAFLVGELERLDPKIYEPLYEVSFGRDIDFRDDVTIADEVSSFAVSRWGSPGGLGTGQGIGTGKSWMGKSTTQIVNPSVDLAKIPHPLRPWAEELSYSILELESAARVGRPIDDLKFQAIRAKHQMDIDEQVYFGDTGFGDTGLLNNSQVTNVANVANGALNSPLFTQKNPPEILNDFNEMLNSAWAASGYTIIPNRAGLPPVQFGYLATQLISLAGTDSILTYLLKNNIMTKQRGSQLEIVPIKWLVGMGAGGTVGTLGTVDRMIAYCKMKDYVRFPMTMLQRTPVQYDGIYHKATYFCRLGVVEVPRPQTIVYRDGI